MLQAIQSKTLLLIVLLAAIPAASAADGVGDLAPIDAKDWNYAKAAHLLERAGFGGTPEEVARYAAMTPQAAVRHLVRNKDVPNPLPD
ncbi:MAG TPA: hypothetical protein VEW72_00700, partial [Burkholderiales bacterium]|nr:hypothetical protein [Burkholderiales bacterium]